MSAPEFVYKIATAAIAAAAERQGVFTGMPIDHQDGYIHLSTAAQLGDTLSLHFRGQQDLVVMALRTAAIAEQLRWEPSRGGDLFPHLYGSLPMSAVVWTEPLAVPERGDVVLPEAVR